MTKSYGSKVPAFCLARFKPQVRVKSSIVGLSKLVTPTQPVEVDQKLEMKDDTSSAVGGKEVLRNGSQRKIAAFAGRKIMIVVDSSSEGKAALQWALTHTVQNTDLVTLLHVVPSNKLSTQGRELSREEMPSKVDELLKSMKKLCKSNKPEVEVELHVVAGKDKGATIVEEARRKGIGMLVLGQKKRSTTLRLLMMWTGGRGGNSSSSSSSSSSVLSVPEYCIQNAPCMTIAVRRKSKKHGGFLITTKRRKDFWLLA